MELVARDYQSSRWLRVRIEDRFIQAVGPVEGPEPVEPSDDWVAPAFWDLQMNGRWGRSFADPGLTVDQVAEIVRAQAPLGTARLCPTLITAPEKNLLHGVMTIAEACRSHPDVAHMVVGIHLEGPFLSERDGYRGAHPLESIRDPDWNLIQTLVEASEGRVALITLAPERPGAIEFIRRAVSVGITIAIGHTAADAPTIRAAVDAGAKLSTHLGNGIASTLPRHPNPIWNQAAEDRLFTSLIADGHHLDADTLRVLARAKGIDRIALVSDASWLAGLPPGRHGEWEIDPAGKVVVAGTPYLAGSNQPLTVGIENLMKVMPCSLDQAIGCVVRTPAMLLGCDGFELAPNTPACLTLFRRPSPDRFLLQRTCVDGVWFDA